MGVSVSQKEEVALDPQAPAQRPGDELPEFTGQPATEERYEPGRYDRQKRDNFDKEEDDDLWDHHDEANGAHQAIPG